MYFVYTICSLSRHFEDDEGDSDKTSEAEDDGKDFRQNLIKTEFKKRNRRPSSRSQSTTEPEAPSWDCPLKEASNFTHIRGLSVKARQHCLNIIESALKENARECGIISELNALLHQAERRAVDLEYEVFLKSKIHTTYRANCIKKANEIKESTKKGKEYDAGKSTESPVKKELVHPRLIAEDTIYADEDEIDDDDEIFSMVHPTDQPVKREPMAAKSGIETKKRTGKPSPFVSALEMHTSGSDFKRFSDNSRKDSESDLDRKKRAKKKKGAFVTASHMLSRTSSAENASKSPKKEKLGQSRKNIGETSKCIREKIGKTSECIRTSKVESKPYKSKTSSSQRVKNEVDTNYPSKEKTLRKLSEEKSKLRTKRKNKVKSASITSFFKQDVSSKDDEKSALVSEVGQETSMLETWSGSPSSTPPLPMFNDPPHGGGVVPDTSTEDNSFSALVRKRFLDGANSSNCGASFKKPKLNSNDDVPQFIDLSTDAIGDDIYSDEFIDDELNSAGERNRENFGKSSEFVRASEMVPTMGGHSITELSEGARTLEVVSTIDEDPEKLSDVAITSKTDDNVENLGELSGSLREYEIESTNGNSAKKVHSNDDHKHKNKINLTTSDVKENSPVENKKDSTFEYDFLPSTMAPPSAQMPPSSNHAKSRTKSPKGNVKQVANVVVKYLSPYLTDGRITTKVIDVI